MRMVCFERIVYLFISLILLASMAEMMITFPANVHRLVHRLKSNCKNYFSYSLYRKVIKGYS